jgi:hypothetical protein
MSEGLKQLHEEQARQCIWDGLVGIVCYKHMLLDDITTIRKTTDEKLYHTKGT